MSEKYGPHPLGGPTYVDENGYVQLRKMEYDAEGTVGGAVSDPCNVQMVILTTPEDAGKGIEHAVKRVLGRTKEIALPFSLRIDMKPYMKFAQIRARWTEEVDSKQVQRIDQAPGNDSIRPGGKQDTRQTEMTLATAVEILKFVECDIYERIAIRKVIEALRPPE